MIDVAAIGFDLGDTLCEYAGIPLNWEREYAGALALVARACGAELTPEQARSGTSSLLRYNTRVTPREDEREVAAEQIFAELLVELQLPSAGRELAIAAFFGHFRRKLRAFPDSVPVLMRLEADAVRTPVPGQLKVPATPAANDSNEITFSAVATSQIRVVFTPQPGKYVGVN